jgi:murein DD-endopeptidase MepM/ murein hydrolase activator NlpD
MDAAAAAEAKRLAEIQAKKDAKAAAIAAAKQAKMEAAAAAEAKRLADLQAKKDAKAAAIAAAKQAKMDAAAARKQGAESKRQEQAAAKATAAAEREALKRSILENKQAEKDTAAKQKQEARSKKQEDALPAEKAEKPAQTEKPPKPAKVPKEDLPARSWVLKTTESEEPEEPKPAEPGFVMKPFPFKETGGYPDEETFAKALEAYWVDDPQVYAIGFANLFADWGDKFYRLTYYFGLRFVLHMRRIARRLRPFFRHAVLFLASFLYIGVFAVKFFITNPLKSLFIQIHDAGREIRRSKPGEGGLKGWRRRYPKAIALVLNTALPIAALLLVLFEIKQITSNTYALQVEFNGQEIGVAANEDIVIQAETQASLHLGGNAAAASLSPMYSLTTATADEFVDVNTLTNNILTSAPGNMTMACGVLVEGKPVAILKNQTDAQAVLTKILEGYKSKMTLGPTDEIGFVEPVETEIGWYPAESDLMMDAAQLETMLTGVKEGKEFVTIGTTYGNMWDIAVAYKTTEDYIKSLNPHLNERTLHDGDQVIVKNEVPYLRVKVVRTETRKVSVPYETEDTPSYNYYQGEIHIRRKGVAGEETVIEKVTYINNQRTGAAEEISRTRTKEPVSELRDIGKKSTRIVVNGETIQINPSAQGFVWPVPALRTITSPYGYRSRGWHSGIDISGSGASGKIIVAAKDGVVEMTQRSGSGYGNQILINHGNGVKTRYAHLLSGSMQVSPGDRVSAGQPIGRVGSTGNSTGPHLHFEVIINGSTQNPTNYVKRP